MKVKLMQSYYFPLEYNYHLHHYRLMLPLPPPNVIVKAFSKKFNTLHYFYKELIKAIKNSNKVSKDKNDLVIEKQNFPEKIKRISKSQIL